MNDHGPEEHPDLREALKRCSPATYYAACKFRQTGAADHLRAVILGVVERYVERELRAKLQAATGTLRLREDLGLDSLTMMEIVMVAEEVLPISISNEELTRLRTLEDVQAFFINKVRAPAEESRGEPSAPAATWSRASDAVHAAKIEAPIVSS